MSPVIESSRRLGTSSEHPGNILGTSWEHPRNRVANHARRPMRRSTHIRSDASPCVPSLSASGN
eukprot:scaffold48_cov311-Pinguiococcus_pyrenoidosus.AAC.256